MMGARVPPKANQLPDNLKKLALRNALDVRHNSFHIDMDKLIQSLKRQLRLSPRALSSALANGPDKPDFLTLVI